MPNRRLTFQNVELYMEYRKKGKQQKTAATKADISERTARRIDKKEHRSFKPRKEKGRTRPDPFTEVWDSFIVPLLNADSTLEGTFLLRELQQMHPGKYLLHVPWYHCFLIPIPQLLDN